MRSGRATVQGFWPAFWFSCFRQYCCRRKRFRFLTQLLGDTKQKIYEIRYGKDGLPEGNLYEADTLHTGEEPVLAIRSEQKKNVYFKGYVGGTYANGVWEPLSGESYRGTSSGMLEWLAKKNFDPLTQTAQYYALGDEEDKPEANRVYVENTGASRYYIYAPASLEKITTRGAASEKKRSVSGRKRTVWKTELRYDRGVILPSGGACCGRFLGGKPGNGEAENVQRGGVRLPYVCLRPLHGS